jgi:transposase-like protein
MGSLKGKSHRQYTDADKAQARALACTMSIDKAALQLGIPARTIGRWAAGQNINRDVLLKEEALKVELADRLDELVDSLVEAVPSKIEEANLSQCATAIGIFIDKGRLLREMPSPDAKVLAGMSREEIAAEAARIKAELAGKALTDDADALQD